MRDPVTLHETVAAHFTLEELRGLCLDLAIRYDDLRGDTISAKAVALQTYMERHRQIPQLVAQLQRLRPRVRWAAFIPAEPEAEPPFKGLEYFSEADADLFYGRDAFTAALMTHLQANRFLAIVGASGSGKSSLVRAGVVPAIRRGALKQNGQTSATWPIYLFTPGEAPLKALAAALTRQVESVSAMKTLLADLRQDGQSLDLWLYRQFIDRPAARPLLVVDQFEEVFSQDVAPDEQTLFIENLVQAVESGSQTGLTLILTLRADFYAQAVRHAALRPLLESGQKIVGPMSREELRQAIEAPAAAQGWQFQPGLVELILRDMGAAGQTAVEAGTLPLLSHALLETWLRREGRTLTLAGYQAAGGVHQAIAATADAVYHNLPPADQTAARHLFLQLTEPGLATEHTRRRVPLAQLLPDDEAAPAVQAVLDRLVKNRLVTVNEATVTLTHEAIIRAWPALQTWLEENRASLHIQRQLAAAVETWLAYGEDAGALYRGLPLVQAEAWAAEHDGQLTPVERQFLAASRQAILAEAAAQARARRQAQRKPIFSFLGGAGGMALSFLLLVSPTVGNPALLLLLMGLRLVTGGLAGFLLIFLVEGYINRVGRSWAAWAGSALTSGAVFAALLYSDTLLRASAADSGLAYAALAGLVWGLPVGPGQMGLATNGRFRGTIWLVTAAASALLLLLAHQIRPLVAEASAWRVLLAGATVPLAILLAAHLADPAGDTVP